MKKRIISCLILLFVITNFTACQKTESDILIPFSVEENSLLNYSVDSPLKYADGFAHNIAVVPINSVNSADSDKINSQSAILVDATDGTVLFEKNVHQKQYPASTTKLLTALIAVKYGDTTATRTIGDEIIFDEDNVVVCDYRKGDVIPFDILIHGALMRSGNDAAAALALTVSDSIKDFSVLMNKEAKSLGATESNFVNPHGLFNENHYSTAYDMYLIFNEAIKYPYIIDVLSCKSYKGTFIRETSYSTYNINCIYSNSNKYISGELKAPAGITIIGGKSGYTELAKRSYIMLAEANGHKYIFVLMRADNVNKIYSDLNYLLGLIPTSEK